MQSREHRGRFCRYALLFIVFASLPPRAAAQVETSRVASLDHFGRGTAAFRTGDMAAAVQEWSEAIRLARLIPAPDLEVQALARRGEAYRTQGYLRDADADLRAALAEAEASGNQNLIAASSGAMGNLELAARHTDLAEPLLVRSRDLARRLGDRNTLAASENDLGNLYAQTGRAAAAADAYGEAIASAAAAGDDTMVATVEVNAARLALRRNDPAHARALLTRAVDRLQRAPPSYSGAMALVSAGSAVPDRKGNISAEDRRIAERAFEAAARAADSLHNATDASATDSGSVATGGNAPVAADPLPGAIYGVSMATFVNPASDYRLAPGSPLIGVGSSYGSFAVNCDPNKPPCPMYTTYNFDSPDIIGTVRPQAGRYDIGAWQSTRASTAN